MNLIQRLEALRPQLAAAAQAVYDDWEGEDDMTFGYGGICDEVSQAMAGVIVGTLEGVEVDDGGQDGDDHAWLVVSDGTETVEVDIPPGVYETGGGYNWQKIEGVTIAPQHVVIERLASTRTAGTQLRDLLWQIRPEFDEQAPVDNRGEIEQNVQGATLQVPCPEPIHSGHPFNMTLMPRSDGRMEWRCTYPGCHGNHLADARGVPVGVPADQETRRMRTEAHRHFDPLHRGRGSLMTERRARQWMAEVMGIPEEDAHIGLFTADECRRLIREIRDYFGPRRQQASIATRLLRVAQAIDGESHDLADRIENMIRGANWDTPLGPDEDPWADPPATPPSRSTYRVPGSDFDPDSVSLTCPECGGRLRLKPSRYGPFWGCENWAQTGCKGSVSAHKADGRPMGTPVPVRVKGVRHQAHLLFDQLWQGPQPLMSRDAAYRWLAETMGMTAEQAHIGEFGEEECLRLIEAAGPLLQRLREQREQRQRDYAAMSPAEKATQHERDVAAKHMQKLYNGPTAIMSRDEAYAFMAESLGLTPDQAHVSMLDRKQAANLVRLINLMRKERSGQSA